VLAALYTLFKAFYFEPFYFCLGILKIICGYFFFFFRLKSNPVVASVPVCDLYSTLNLNNTEKHQGLREGTYNTR
jgi:hypothetical protein